MNDGLWIVNQFPSGTMIRPQYGRRPARLYPALAAAIALHVIVVLAIPPSGPVITPDAETPLPVVFTSLQEAEPAEELAPHATGEPAPAPVPEPAPVPAATPPSATEPAPAMASAEPPAEAHPDPTPQADATPPADPMPTILQRADLVPSSVQPNPMPDLTRSVGASIPPGDVSAERAPESARTSAAKHRRIVRQEPLHATAPTAFRKAAMDHSSKVTSADTISISTTQGHPEAEQTTSASVAAAEDSFQGRLLQSIQAEVRRNYPMSARLMGITGQPVIAFEYRDGHVSAVRLTSSCGSPALDRAAVAAVEAAVYPPPPTELVGRTLARQVHVKYELTNTANAAR